MPGDPGTTPPIPIERIEMVTYERGYQEPSEPMWRIVLNGYCADFPSEQAARNFADQIASVKENEPKAYCGLCSVEWPSRCPHCPNCGAGKLNRRPAQECENG